MRCLLAVAAAKRLRLSICDVENCFQNTIIEPSQRIFITSPFRYVDWFKDRYPDTKVRESKSGKYALQTINGMQGEKDAGANWYLTLVRIFQDFGLNKCPAEPALFTFYEGSEQLLIVTSTDDFLCAHSSDGIFYRFTEHMKKYVPITIESASVMKYLNCRIVQTDLGVSFDQTHHIRTTILDVWFPKDSTERLKTADTPYRTDSQFEKDMCEQLPATGDQLVELETKYGGKFNSLIGVLLHVFQVSRYELGFTISRLGQYNCAPNAAAFEGLRRVGRFLATHPHSPIMYPRAKFTAYTTIRWEVEPGRFIEQVISNFLAEFVDSDHARDTKTRRSISCIMAMLLGVLVDWQMGKQSCVAAHSTDAEIRAYFSGMMKNEYLRQVMEFPRVASGEPTPIYEDNQPAIDIIVAGSITARVKHMAVVIAMIKEAMAKGSHKPIKIDGRINPADIGTKPNPASTFHRNLRVGRGQQFYPHPASEHGKLMQVELVCNRLNEFETGRVTQIDFRNIANTAVYDHKEKHKQKSKSN